MAEAEDSLIAECASRLRERRLPKCIDIRRWIEQEIPSNPGMDTREKADREAKIRLVCKSISERIEDWSASNSKAMPRNMVDQTRCTPYKKFQDSKTLLNQILISQGDGSVRDMAEISPVVASAQTYEVCRSYYAEGDTEAKSVVQNIMRTTLAEITNAEL